MAQKWQPGGGITGLFQAYSMLFVAILAAWRTPRIFALLLVCLLIALVQAFVFTLIEGWRFIDAFYFAVVSMATVGYGDFAPVTTLAKLSALVFLVVGIGVFVLTVTSIAQVIMAELIRAEECDPPSEGLQDGQEAASSPPDRTGVD